MSTPSNIDDRLGALAGHEIPKPGLERIAEALGRVGAPHLRVPVVLVTGTNGKGTTAALIVRAAQANGLRVGLHTSPHLTTVRERICIDGEMLSSELWHAALDRHADALAGLTYFELVTALAWIVFDEARVDLAVMEIGLGGRWDATNVAGNVRASVIVSVGLDHTEYLGPTLAAIAAEKAEIARRGVPLFTGFLPDEARETVVRAAARIGAPVAEVAVPDPAEPNLSLAWTTPIARRVVEHLGLRWPTDIAAVGALPGRQELVRAAPPLVLDVAHNPAAVALLARRLRTLADGPVWNAYFAIARRKDAAGVVHAIAPLVHRWTTVEIAEEGFDAAHTAGIVSAATGVAPGRVTLADAARGLSQATAPTVVFGSFRLVGPLREGWSGAAFGDSSV